MTKHLRSALAILLALLFCFLCVACGGADTPDDTTLPGTDAPDTDAPDTGAPDTAESVESEPADDRPENVISVYVTAGAAEDGADGSAEHPYATLEAARDAVRAIERTDDLTGIDVFVEGIFRRTETFELTGEDSGSRLCPVRWTSKDGAILSGGIELSESDFTPADEAFSAYFDEEVRGKILCADLKTFGVDPAATAFDDLTPFQKSQYNSLFCGNTRLTLARYPDGKYISIGDPETLEDGNYRMKYTSIHDTRIANWHDKEHVYVTGYFAVLWGSDWSRVLSFEEEGAHMIVKNNDHYTPNKGMPIYWYNIPEELNTPGEYYLTEDAVLYYYPLTDDEHWTVTYPTLQTELVRCKADYVTFENLAFEDSQGSALSLDGDHLTVESCLVRRIGALIAVQLSGDHNRFANTEVANVAYIGVYAESGDTDTLTPGDTVITNNYIHDFSEAMGTYCSGANAMGCGIEISHNEFAFSNHQAISFAGNLNRIEYNEIHDVCTFTDDAGAIYAGKSYEWYGNIFRYNYIHDIGAMHPGDDYYACGCSAIYWDGGLGGQTAYGNIIENTSGYGMQASGGADCTMKDNLIINCRCGLTDPQGYYDLIFKAHTPLGFDLLENAKKRANEHKEIADAFPTLLQMNSDGVENDPWFWAAPARTEITGNAIYCPAGTEDKAHDIGPQVVEWGTVENNPVRTFKEGEQPDARTALADSGLEIPFDEIGRH